MIQPVQSAVILEWGPPFAPQGTSRAVVAGEGDEDLLPNNPELTATRSAISSASYRSESVAGVASAAVSLSTSFLDEIFTATATGQAEQSVDGPIGASGSFSVSYILWMSSPEPVWVNYSIDGSPVGIHGVNEINYSINGTNITSTGSILLESGSGALAFGMFGTATTPDGANPIASFASTSTITLSFTPIPEPNVSTLSFFALVVFAAAMIQRQKSRS